MPAWRRTILFTMASPDSRPLELRGVVKPLEDREDLPFPRCGGHPSEYRSAAFQDGSFVLGNRFGRGTTVGLDRRAHFRWPHGEERIAVQAEEPRGVLVGIDESPGIGIENDAASVLGFRDPEWLSAAPFRVAHP